MNKITQTIFALLLLHLLVSNLAWATSSLKVEVLNSNTAYNYFSLPNDNESNRIDLPQLKNAKAYRLFYEKKWTTWSMTVLYAPLEVEYNFTSDKNFKFNNSNFATNQNTTTTYKFNSYRLGLRKNYSIGSSRFYYGGLLKIRDAKLCVSQASITDCYDNVGPVPLLNAGLELNGQHFYLHSNVDGLWSSRGSAYDLNIETGWIFNKYFIGLGFRMLGGGADNETLVNFAQFQSIYLSLTI